LISGWELLNGIVKNKERVERSLLDLVIELKRWRKRKETNGKRRLYMRYYINAHFPGRMPYLTCQMM
jgi:hypothetical protein